MSPVSDFPPIRPELAGIEPYGAPQLDVPVRLNVNENPYGPSEAVIAQIAAAVTDAARDLNRYPERDAVALRGDLAAYLGHGLTADHVWAANGSNEVMLHVLQAFAGPARTCSITSFDPFAAHTFAALNPSPPSEFRYEARSARNATASRSG